MPGIIGRYVLRETAQTWLAVTLVLLAILVTNQFATVLGDAAASKLPKDAVFRVMGLTSLQYLIILVPLALFLSILLAFGRLYRDGEMAALMACGVSPAGLYRPIAGFALLLAALIGWIALDVGPGALREVEAIATRAKQQADLRLIEPGRFLSFGGTGAVLYAEDVDEAGNLRNVFVQRRRGDAVEVVVAARAWQSDTEEAGRRLIRFEDGRRYEGEPGTAEFRIVTFDEHGIPYELPEAGPEELEPEALPLDALFGSPDLTHRAELQWRLAVPLGLLVLSVVAVPLSRTTPRQGRYSGLATGVLLYVIYVNLLGVGRVWMERGELPAAMGLWWVHGLFLAAALLMLARQSGRLRLRPAPRPAR